MPHPVLAMPMWEGAGNRAIDLSGHGNHGAITGAGWVNNGLSFDGNDYISVADNAIVELTFPFTITAHLQYTTAGNVVIIEKDGNGGYSLQSYLGKIFLNVGGFGVGNRVQSSITINDNKTHKVVFTVWGSSNEQSKVYIDGIDVTDESVCGTPNYSTGSLYLGSRGGSFGFPGIMDNVNLYNVVFSAAQVKFLYDNPYFMYQIPEELYGYVAAGGTIRELSTTIASTTTLSSASTNVLREITTSIDATTATTAKLRILREMSSAIASTTATSAISANILREMQAAIAVSTTTATSNLLLLREISSTIAATTSTSTPAFNVLRELTSTIAATTSLSQIELLVGVLRELSTTVVASTSTSASEVNILRELTSALAAQTTSIATLDILREITVTVVAGTSLSQIELLLGTLRELTTTVAATTTTSTPAFNVLREFTSTVGATTASSAKVDILRELVSTIAAQTTLSQIELLVGALIELSTTIAASTSTSAANLNVVRAFATTVSATTSTSEITILMVRALSAQIAAGTDVGAATVLVLREFSTSVDATTLTSSIELLLEAVQIIINTQIHPFTPEQIATSFTPKRLISST